MDVNQIEGLLISHGYKKKEYGFVKKGKDVSQAVTLFPNNEFQMWGWYNGGDDSKLYDTSIVEITDYDLFSKLIILFDQHSKI